MFHKKIKIKYYNNFTKALKNINKHLNLIN